MEERQIPLVLPYVHNKKDPEHAEETLNKRIYSNLVVLMMSRETKKDYVAHGTLQPIFSELRIRFPANGLFKH